MSAGTNKSKASDRDKITRRHQESHCKLTTRDHRPLNPSRDVTQEIKVKIIYDKVTIKSALQSLDMLLNTVKP